MSETSGVQISTGSSDVLSVQKRFFSEEMRQGLELPKGFDIVTILVSQWLCVSMCVHEMVCDSFKQLHIFAFDSWDYQVLSFLWPFLSAARKAQKVMKPFLLLTQQVKICYNMLEEVGTLQSTWRWVGSASCRTEFLCVPDALSSTNK